MDSGYAMIGLAVRATRRSWLALPPQGYRLREKRCPVTQHPECKRRNVRVERAGLFMTQAIKRQASEDGTKHVMVADKFLIPTLIPERML